MRNPLLIVLVIVSISVLKACDKNEQLPDDAPDISIFNVSNDTEWDYWVVGKDGDHIFVIVDDNKPTTAYYTPDPLLEGYSVFFNGEGMPEKVVINDYILLFRNFSGTKIDAAAILPDGSIKIARDLETGISWDGELKKSMIAPDPSDWLRWTGHALGAAACYTGLAAAPATFGLSLGLTIVGCGGTAVSIISEILPEEFEVLGITSSTIGSIATAVGCVGNLGVSCAFGTASSTFSLMSQNQEIIENAAEEEQITVAALNFGYGDVQITLTWNSTADLDLHVIDPAGEELYWSHPYSNSNGVLDVDDRDGDGPENIYWSTNMAPLGKYEVYVHHYLWPISDYPVESNYNVLVNAFGRIEIFTGTISLDQSKHIIDFDQNGFYRLNLKSTFDITKSKK